MPLVPMTEMLADAREKRYAVGCFNSIDLQMARGILMAAEAERSPVIICHAESHFCYTPLEKIVPVLVHEAKSATVPVAVLLDHGESIDTVSKAMHLGLNAVMFDGSGHTYEHNIEKTQEVVKMAKALHVCVEGELGRVPRPKSGGTGSEDDSIIHDSSLLTDPDMAFDFVQRTGIDVLACAFGTMHGVYLEKPKLDFARLREIAQKTSLPIVMHGGSGLSQTDFEEAIENGVCKINCYTNMALKIAGDIQKKCEQQDRCFYHEITQWTIESVREYVQDTIRIFRSSGKA